MQVQKMPEKLVAIQLIQKIKLCDASRVKLTSKKIFYFSDHIYWEY